MTVRVSNRKISFRNSEFQLLLTNICSLDRCLWRPEPQTDVFVPSPATFSHPLALRGFAFVVEEDVWLLLKSSLGLNCQLRRHDCDFPTILLMMRPGSVRKVECRCFALCLRNFLRVCVPRLQRQSNRKQKGVEPPSFGLFT